MCFNVLICIVLYRHWTMIAMVFLKLYLCQDVNDPDLNGSGRPIIKRVFFEFNGQQTSFVSSMWNNKLSVWFRDSSDKGSGTSDTTSIHPYTEPSISFFVCVCLCKSYERWKISWWKKTTYNLQTFPFNGWISDVGIRCGWQTNVCMGIHQQLLSEP